MSLEQSSRVSDVRPDSVSIDSPVTVFDEVSVALLTPLVQIQHVYSINSRLLSAISAGTGAASVSNSLMTCSTGATASSDVLLRSVLDAQYHPGQGTLARFTAIFQATGIAGTEAVRGVGQEEDGFFFGYDGAIFGILHRREGKLEHQTLTVSAGAGTASGTITLTLDGEAVEVEVVISDSPEAVARAIGAVTYLKWETQVIGADVVFISHLAEVKAGAFAFADTDTTGVAASFAETITGAAPTEVWIPQAEWNIDRMLASTDPASSPSGIDLLHDMENVYQIKFGWLGADNILFSIKGKEDSKFKNVHKIKYLNSNTGPSIQNPTLPLYTAVKNNGSATDIVVKGSSGAIFTEGLVAQTFLNNATTGIIAGDVTVETSMLALKNKPVFQGVSNRVEWRPQDLTFSANGTAGAKVTTLRIHINPTLGGDPSFSDIDTETSIIAKDIAGTTVSGGSVAATFVFGALVRSFTLSLLELNLREPPGTLIVFTVQTDAGTTDAQVGVVWRELF